MLPDFLLLASDHISMLIRVAGLGVHDRSKTVFRAERDGVVVWMVAAAAAFVGFCFVYEEGDAWFLCSGV